MKNYIIIALMLILTSSAIGQKKHPMERSPGIGEDPSMVCTTLDEPTDLFKCGGVPVTLYQSSSNKLLPVFAATKEKKYLFEIGEAGIQLTNLRVVPSRSVLALEIRYTGPNASVIAEQVRRSNPSLNGLSDAQLNPVCMLGYAISYPGATPDWVDCGAGGCSIAEPIFSELAFLSLAEAQTAYDDLIAGSSFVEFRYAVGKDNLAGFAKVSADQERIFNSNAYRDLISPVAGRTISIFQAYVAAAAVRQELRSDVAIGGETDQLLRAFGDAWSELLGFERKIPVGFEQPAAHQLVDLNSNRYATDLIRRLSEDTERLSDYDWCLKYRQELKRHLEDAKKSHKSGSGGVNVWGIKVSGDGGSSYDRRFVNHLEELLAQEDCGGIKKHFKESFVFEGEKYIPKGIYATEFTQSQSEIFARHYFLGRFYKFEVRQQTRRLKYEP